MRKFPILITLGALAIVTTPAVAGLGDFAKTVLSGKSVLKTAEKKCGSSLALTPKDNLTLDTAVSAARKALLPAEFLKLDEQAESEAKQASQASGFCNDTKAKKKGILSKVGGAGKKLLGKKLGI